MYMWSDFAIKLLHSFRKATNLVGDEIHLQKPELNDASEHFENTDDDHHVLEKYTFSNALALSGES